VFRDRIDAGDRLAEHLAGLADRPVVVLGLPRGGVPVAARVAHRLDAPLDVIVVRKLGVPGHRELALGAIGEGGARVLDAGLMARLGVRSEDVARVEAEERHELTERVGRLRGDHPPADLEGRVVVIVDDGIATGSTARAACRVARARGAAEVVVAAPVGPPEAAEALADAADQVVLVETPRSFGAVGAWYDDFRPTSDEEVAELLAAG
jgi:predicted phosphoribosyltransferase